LIDKFESLGGFTVMLKRAQRGEPVMSYFRLLSAAAIVAAAIASPALAQQVIYEPGYCAQFYPTRELPERRTRQPL